MENYAVSQKKNPLCTVWGILFMVAGAIFLLPYLAASVPSLVTFFVALYNIFANLFSFTGEGLSMAFVSFTPFFNSIVELLQCFVGPVALIMTFVLLAFRNEEKASVFAVLNLISSIVTLFGGRVSLMTLPWAVNLLADLVLAFAVLAFALCEGKLRRSPRWLYLAIFAGIIRIVAMVLAGQESTQLFANEYFPVYDYEAFIASHREYVAAVLKKKNIGTEVKLSQPQFKFAFADLADNWKAYMSAANAVDAVSISDINQYDDARGMASSIAGMFNGVSGLAEILYTASACLLGVFGCLMLNPSLKAVKE